MAVLLSDSDGASGAFNTFGIVTQTGGETSETALKRTLKLLISVEVQISMCKSKAKHSHRNIPT